MEAEETVKNLKLGNDPRRRAVWERRKQKAEDDKLIEMGKHG